MVFLKNLLEMPQIISQKLITSETNSIFQTIFPSTISSFVHHLHITPVTSFPNSSGFVYDDILLR